MPSVVLRRRRCRSSGAPPGQTCHTDSGWPAPAHQPRRGARGQGAQRLQHGGPVHRAGLAKQQPGHQHKECRGSPACQPGPPRALLEGCASRAAAHAAGAVQAGLRVAWRVGSAAGPALALVMTGSWRGSHPAQVGNQRMGGTPHSCAAGAALPRPRGEACTWRQLWFMRCDRRRCSCALKARSWMMTLASRFSDRLSGSRLLDHGGPGLVHQRHLAVQRAVAVFVNAHPGAQQVVIQQRRGRAHDGHVGLALQDQPHIHTALAARRIE